MDDTKTLFFLINLYFMKGRLVRFQILNHLHIDSSGNNYKVLDKLINRGYLNKIDDNPEVFEVGKEERKLIWKTLKSTETGKNFLDVVRDNTFMVDV